MKQLKEQLKNSYATSENHCKWPSKAFMDTKLTVGLLTEL